MREEPEEWLEAPAPFLRYLVSTHGRCFNVATGRLLQPTVTKARRTTDGGYPAYRLTPDSGSRVYTPIGALMWRTYVGPVGAGHMVRRIDPAAGWRLRNIEKVNMGSRLVRVAVIPEEAWAREHHP